MLVHLRAGCCRTWGLPPQVFAVGFREGAANTLRMGRGSYPRGAKGPVRRCRCEVGGQPGAGGERGQHKREGRGGEPVRGYGLYIPHSRAEAPLPVSSRSREGRHRTSRAQAEPYWKEYLTSPKAAWCPGSKSPLQCREPMATIEVSGKGAWAAGGASRERRTYSSKFAASRRSRGQDSTTFPGMQVRSLSAKELRCP